MLASLIIVFREVLEAGLITGIVLAASQGVPKRNLFVFSGIAAGIVGACIVAMCADFIADAFAGDGQEILNASVLGVAVLMLAWHNIWMAKHGRILHQQMTQVGKSVASGIRPLYALSTVVGLAVLREGAEVVLFLYSIVVSGHETNIAIATGSFLGILSGIFVAVMLYRGLLRIPMRHLFKVTGWLISFVAAGMASQAMAFLAQAGLVIRGQSQLWDTSSILADNTIVGKALHVLFGYTDRPSEAQLFVYVIVLATILFAAKLVRFSTPERPKSLAIS